MTAEMVAENICIDFPIYHGSSRSLKKTVLAAASGRLGQDVKHRVVVQALRNVSFELRPGDRLGLIGGNGAGKTTLLRALAGIYEPVVGRLRVQGAVGSLLDINSGMNMELTGRENIQLRGLYYGMSAQQIAHLIDEVIDFAELGEFLELPLRFYSSGMAVRLAFGLATSIQPQILLMDEWFLAGDAAFLDKARRRMETLVRQAEILVLSSHMMPIIAEWATRVIWLDHGRVREDGSAKEVLGYYSKATGAEIDETVPTVIGSSEALVG
jgi:lipopolysaccharide transport system ATP-binding protein